MILLASLTTLPTWFLLCMFRIQLQQNTGQDSFYDYEAWTKKRKVKEHRPCLLEVFSANCIKFSNYGFYLHNTEKDLNAAVCISQKKFAEVSTKCLLQRRYISNFFFKLCNTQDGGCLTPSVSRPFSRKANCLLYQRQNIAKTKRTLQFQLI